MDSLINSFENTSIHDGKAEYEELQNLSAITKSYLDIYNKPENDKYVYNLSTFIKKK